MSNEIRKCLVCAMGSEHRFKDCANPACDCICIEEIRGEEPLDFNEYPKWFQLVSRKDAQRFTKIHVKKGS
jgi:hypothetical protein